MTFPIREEQDVTMSTTAQPEVRELDRRTNDGIDVRLLWNPRRNRVSVAVKDERSGESFEFEVDSANALAAFHHPFAQAPPDSPAHRVLYERTGGVPQQDSLERPRS
jgi:hypothetical protein